MTVSLEIIEPEPIKSREHCTREVYFALSHQEFIDDVILVISLYYFIDVFLSMS